MIIDNKINVNFSDALNDIKIPKMFKIKQSFNILKIDNIECEIKKQLKVLDSIDLNNKRIAITVGSRGINKLYDIIFEIIKYLKSAGAKPFIVPAMGSHAGAKAEEQSKMIQKLGIDYKSLDVEIVSSMKVVQIGVLYDNTPIYCDKIAFDSDGIIVMNKIKPHADFKGELESGLSKMMAIGLGKHKGAMELHKLGFHRFKNIIIEAGEIFIKNAPILCGIGIVENAYDEPFIIECIMAENILKREKELLKIAKQNIATINVEYIDVLIIDEIGKDISGEGMDPNVTGRPGSFLNDGFLDIVINKIVIRGITEKSGGNGAGIGMADITTLKCARNLDLGLMYTNSITAGILAPSKLPVILNNDEEAIKVAIKTSLRGNIDDIRIVHIKNTLNLNEMYASEAVIGNMTNNFQSIGDGCKMVFDCDGYFLKYS